MKLSVITICYNEKNIRKTCESIVGQSWQDFEWIVVDGGSTDGTLDVLNEYRDRIDVLISEPDNGIYNAMNKGIARARGEWLNFMNGGDAFCDKTVLEQVFGGGSSRDGADVLYGDMLCRERYTKCRLPLTPISLSTAASTISRRSSVPHCSASRAVITKITGFCRMSKNGLSG